MPSVLEISYKYSVTVRKEKAEEARRYMETEIGPRTYWLSQRVGGKTWVMLRPQSSEPTIGVNDEALATFLSLKFS